MFCPRTFKKPVPGPASMRPREWDALELGGASLARMAG